MRETETIRHVYVNQINRARSQEIEVISSTSWRNRYNPQPPTSSSSSGSSVKVEGGDDSNSARHPLSARFQELRQQAEKSIEVPEAREMWLQQGWVSRIGWRVFLNFVKSHFKLDEYVDTDFLKHCIGKHDILFSDFFYLLVSVNNFALCM